MKFAQILCVIGLIMGLFMIICPLRVFKMQNTIRNVFMIDGIEVVDFNIFIYRVGGIFEILIFTLLLTQTIVI